MKVQRKTWQRYISTLSKLNSKAAELVQTAIETNRFASERELTAYAYGIAIKYGEAASALACEMYDSMARLQMAKVPAAVPANVASFQSVKDAVYGAESISEKIIPSATARLVKKAAADTIMKNAGRDHAEYAWVPTGDTCAYCIAIASKGWRKGYSEMAEAEHIHNNCDCQYIVRFSKDTELEGYDSKNYLRMYNDAAPGGSSKDKLNALRRQQYAVDKDRINEQKRAAYAAREDSGT